MHKLIYKTGLMMILVAVLSLPIASATSEVPIYLQNKTYLMQMENQSHYKPKHADIVMLGDSITYNVQWNELLGRNAANRGIGGDYTSGMLNRLEYVTNLTPYMVFIMAGTNDLFKGEVTPETAFQNYVSILDALEQKHITPVITLTLYVGKDIANYTAINERVQKLNGYLTGYARQHEITCIDLNEAIAPEGYLLYDYSIDGIHINGEAYEIWGDKINKIINQILKKES
ncbi:GDSL-type esterase/lipase family protein [Paenibacillus caui]|uniref:GDSL-type esterase/lipase family protein n=1 Tax=Paenibacillus caui TaxID=2873927 RepID=UPI001CA88EB4|nr:GDSL-type esterase/lipase family protein [Paenibacillus caui]